MIKRVVIGKTVRCTAGVIRRIDVDTLHLAPKLQLQTVQCQQIVPFDEQVLANRAIISAFESRDGLFASMRVPFPVREHLRREEPVDFVRREELVEEDLGAFSSSRVWPPSKTQSL